MTTKFKDQFEQALNLCQWLKRYTNKPSSNPCTAIKLLCKVSDNPETLIELLTDNAEAVKEADEIVTDYAASIDNWKCDDCPLGTADLCNVLHFFFNLHKSYDDLLFFRGRDLVPEAICELLKEWKNIDLLPYLPKR